MEEVRSVLTAYYLQIKFIHVLMAAMWTFSTAVAYRNYVVPAFKAWERNRDDPRRIATRNDAMERFDRGAQLEHIAFPLVLISGLLMAWIGGWPLTEWNWLTVKLALVIIIFLPVEIVDYYISHLGGNKEKIRATGDMARYETMVQFHWLFFRVTTPLVVVFIPAIFYFAITKPL